MIHLLLTLFELVKSHQRKILVAALGVASVMLITLSIGKLYQNWDNDPDRGAVAIDQGAMGESYDTPIYLDQGWDNADSLWFYNTTQGSNVMPYDLFMALEQSDSDALFRSRALIDKYRYLPQKPTFFNPDGLPVGIVKDTYQGKSYIGYTCAACHTGQINYRGQAIRIDGGPAMADMVGFLTDLQNSMQKTLTTPAKLERFVARVLERDGDYDNKAQVIAGLKEWENTLMLYNGVNHSQVDYGYARLDAFGRIYNRVLKHVINKKQVRSLLLLATNADGTRMLTAPQVDIALEGVDETIIGNKNFAVIFDRLRSGDAGHPKLSRAQLFRLRDLIFNEPNAPVSYPFLWDITHSDYVQWNGIANNAGVGPLGRNAGQVIGVFGTLDWSAQEPGFSLSAKISGQSKKHKRVDFKSSINLINLRRFENHLQRLKSPEWPEAVLGKIDREKAARGELIYERYCLSCHEVIDRNNWDRVVIAKMSGLDKVGTDPQMALNSVNYKGKSGNFKHTVQQQAVGGLYIPEEAPVAMILTSVTRGTVATPDPDKWWIRRWLDWLYMMASSVSENEIEETVKSGNYPPDTTAEPLRSLLAYKARSLNGIWATAPYLHNGSVPTLYELLLPKKRPGDPDEGNYRPERFEVGAREFDPIKVGFVSEGFDGFVFDTTVAGNLNSGHEYAAGRTAQLNGEVLPALSDAQRWDLVEYLKTL
ncbi:MAG TPA: di-heme-cytochrome C peroxidase [Marinagarivorans sp.]